MTRATFRRKQDKRELVEAFFDWCRNAPITVFAVGMERPTKPLNLPPNYLPNQFRYLLQRVDLLLQGKDDFGVILFDGDGSQFGGLPRRFESFLHRSVEGQSMQKVADAPFFVDSRITTGIQIADMAAGAIRIYQENGLFRGIPAADPFLSAVGRYYRILHDKTIDQVSVNGYDRPGFFWMPEQHHYMEETGTPLETTSEALE